MRTAPNLRRRRHRREPKCRFIVLCEGKKTEPAYFEAVKYAYRDTLVEVETYPAVGVPYTIAEKAIEYARVLGLDPRSRRKKNSFEENDQVWAVFDRDEHPRFDEAVALCERFGVHIGRSNPCFELWLILHEQDHNRAENRHEMQKIFESLRPEYKKDSAKTPDCVNLVSRVEKAEERSERQLQNHEQGGSPYGNPSTTVGRLTRAIREAAKLAGG
ncbi:MAG: RloB family protein [Nitrospinae bacterium]|nr:RloB family protein [Nitrospinota bacterium]